MPLTGGFSLPSSTSLEIVTNLKKLDSSAFAQNTGFENVKIPEGMEEIGDCAFANNTNLKTIIFPKTLKKIGNEAFSGCTSLERVIIGNGVKKIGNNIFSGCSILKEIFYWAGADANVATALSQSKNAAEVIPCYRFNLPCGVTVTSDPVFESGGDKFYAKKISLKDSTGETDVPIK